MGTSSSGQGIEVGIGFSRVLRGYMCVAVGGWVGGGDLTLATSSCKPFDYKLVLSMVFKTLLTGAKGD